MIHPSDGRSVQESAQGPWHKLDSFLRRMVPSVIIALVILLLSAPLGIPQQQELLPAFVFSSVYFWSFACPRFLSSISVFLLGFLFDLLSFDLPGVIILILLLIHGVGAWQANRIRGFSLLGSWATFIIVSAVAIFLQWGMVSALKLRIMPWESVIFQYVLTIGVYPVLAIFFLWLSQKIATQNHI